MFSAKDISNPVLAFSGLDADLTREETDFQVRVRDFALGVMRPLGAALDKMAAGAVSAPGSPLWTYLDEFARLGISRAALAPLGPERLKRIWPIIFEELGYGDWGLAVIPFITAFPELAVRATGDVDLIDRFAHRRGCWVATQPDRGSDAVDYEGFELAAGATQSSGGLHARVGNREIILTGHSSSWIACAPIADFALVHCPADYGDGWQRPDGGVFGAAILVPFDLPGVTQGPALEKIGQRSLPTGSIRFDEVSVPAKYLIWGKDDYYASVLGILASGAMDMAAIATGAGRAAFECGLGYARHRHQGGAPLIRHQLMRWRVFEMWRKLEAARATVRRVAAYNYAPRGPHILASITAKVTASRAAFEIVSEATEIFGANGRGQDGLVEKLFRDIQTGLPEAGDNHVLGLQAANWLLRAFPEPDGYHNDRDGAGSDRSRSVLPGNGQ
jgi:alkylation response protein AidB-like acyl-CoA dehydrogenase